MPVTDAFRPMAGITSWSPIEYSTPTTWPAGGGGELAAAACVPPLGIVLLDADVLVVEAVVLPGLATLELVWRGAVVAAGPALAFEV
jgi:hypothetical protein